MKGILETARYLYDVAMDEAHHAADFAILLAGERYKIKCQHDGWKMR